MKFHIFKFPFPVFSSVITQPAKYGKILSKFINFLINNPILKEKNLLTTLHRTSQNNQDYIQLSVYASHPQHINIFCDIYETIKYASDFQNCRSSLSLAVTSDGQLVEPEISSDTQDQNIEGNSSDNSNFENFVTDNTSFKTSNWSKLRVFAVFFCMRHTDIVKNIMKI